MRAVIDGPIGQELLDKISASPARLVGLALDGRRIAQPLHQEAGAQGRGPEGP
jgi:hypothetical protein